MRASRTRVRPLSDLYGFVVDRSECDTAGRPGACRARLLTQRGSPVVGSLARCSTDRQDMYQVPDRKTVLPYASFTCAGWTFGRACFGVLTGGVSGFGLSQVARARSGHHAAVFASADDAVSVSPSAATNATTNGALLFVFPFIFVLLSS